MGVRVVVGLQWGDEGKGKVVDWLAEEADLISRYQGGANAGHTVQADGRTSVFHLIPCGILHPGKVCAIGNGVVIDPECLIREMGDLERRGVQVRDRLFVSHAAHLVLPLHRILDGLWESSRYASPIGTTGRGIGPAYSDKAGRVGIRMVDLLDESSLGTKIGALVERHEKSLAPSSEPPIHLSEYVSACGEYRRHLAPLIADVSGLVNDAIDRGDSVLLEGAQGTLLDLDHGTYPYVTSSNPVAGAAGAGCGIGPTRITDVVGVVKAYTTRVGEGPFPTEIVGPEGDLLRRAGGEFGATTGRPRRCGWLDLVAVRRSARINHVSELIVTKLDVLDGLLSVHVCVDYRTPEGVLHDLPMEPWLLEKCEPVYREFEGWEKTVGGAPERGLPDAARRFLDFIASEIGVPIRMVSAGTGRRDMIRVG